MASENYDYLIVGGGSSGCVVAGRLSERADCSVLVLESGDAAEEHPETLYPDGYKRAFINDRLMWERFSVSQPGCNDRQLFMGSGTGLGGSGSINAMVYLRGDRLDYGQWGVPGWNWNDIVEDYQSLESVLSVHQREPTEFTECCIRAAQQAGFARKLDFHDGNLAGFLGYEWMNYQETQRRSSYVAFVKAFRPTRENLKVRTRSRVNRIIFDDDSRAREIEYIDRDGQFHRVGANREIILCAGALESPRLLMLSGIGPAEQLVRHGIPIVHENRNVGQNLQDHPNVTLFFHGTQPIDCNYPQLYGFHRCRPESRLAAEQADTCFVFYPARSSLKEAMQRLLPGMILPETIRDIRVLREAIRKTVGLALSAAAMQRMIERLYGIVVILGKPQSRGSVRIVSSRIQDAVDVNPSYFGDNEDMETMVRAVELARKIAHAPALRDWGNREIFPSKLTRSSSAIEQWIRNNAMTTYHYAGTCKMSEHGDGVVDPQLRVYGVEGLRVADASVIPIVPVSALNAPSMLIGYRAANFIYASQR